MRAVRRSPDGFSTFDRRGDADVGRAERGADRAVGDHRGHAAGRSPSMMRSPRASPASDAGLSS